MDPLESFVADPANLAAVTAARTAADLDHALFSPLVISGPRGSGKSHLLRAIKERGASRRPPRNVELISLGRLADLMHTRGFGEGARSLRDRLVAADLLLLDDFELIARHLSAQAVVFDLVEARLTSGRDLVIATSVDPGQIDGLDPRLRKRVVGGTAVSIGLPGAPARRAILEQHAAERGVALGADVIEAIAEQDLASVREYIGALNRVLAFQQAASAPIPAPEALALIGLESRPPSVAEPAATGELFVPDDAVAVGVSLSEGSSSEFDSFLSDVVANVAQQFDQWRTRVSAVITHWRSRGVRTRRLDDLLTAEIDVDPEPIIASFERDATELAALAQEAAGLAPDVAGAEVLRDPDQLAAARHLVVAARQRGASLSAPLPDLTLETLGTGPSNRHVLAAIQAVIAEPAARQAPLVIIGASGTGKTHVMHAIGNALASAGVSPVACLSAHSFLGEFSAITTSDELAHWRARYQWVGAFAIDDVQVLANEPRAQDELARIGSALVDAQRPFVVTSAVRVADLSGFTSLLASKLQLGSTVELAPPDREIRLSVIKGLLSQVQGGDDAALLDYLASREHDSVRAVHAMVERLRVEAGAQRVPLSPAVAREIFEAATPKAPGPTRAKLVRASGILSPGMGAVRSREKMILRWPAPAERLMLELR